MKACSYCAEDILDAAIVCKHCGRDLMKQTLIAMPPPAAMPATQTVIVHQVPVRLWSPGVAAVLSLVIPGAGQMYKGQVANGLVWLVMVAIGYVMFILPGILLHICCIAGAASGNPYRETQSIGGQPTPYVQPKPKRGAAVGCPKCAKTVRIGDISCKHCGSELAWT